jgi:cupin 2 domain-containing protein
MTGRPPRQPDTIVSSGNLFAQIPDTLKQEQFTELAGAGGVRIERIVSRGHACGPDDWYDEEDAEWVVVLAGSARLVFEDETEPRLLTPGDYVHIPPHRRHRVDWTDPGQPTIWLAVHFG